MVRRFVPDGADQAGHEMERWRGKAMVRWFGEGVRRSLNGIML